MNLGILAFVNSLLRTTSNVRYVALVLLAAGFVLSGETISAEPTGEIRSDRTVRTAIADGMRFLEANLRADGSLGCRNWRYQNGAAEALYLLAALQQDPQADRVRRIAPWVFSEPMERTTARAMRVLAAVRMEPIPQDQIAEDTQWLLGGQCSNGGWRVQTGTDDPRCNTIDTAWALLALRQAERAGQSVPAEVWTRAGVFLRQTYYGNGQWGYQPSTSTPLALRFTPNGMSTSAAVSAVGVCLEQGTPHSSTPTASAMQTVDWGTYRDGLDWLRRHCWPMRVAEWFWGDEPRYANAYFFTQAGRLFSPLALDDKDLSNVLLPKLLAAQQDDGSFQGEPNAEDSIIATALAVVTLQELTKPLMMNLHAPEMSANEGNAMEQLCQWLAQQQHRRATWRRLAGGVGVEQLRQAPLLVLMGEGKFSPEPSFQEAVRSYLRGGGVVLVVSAGGDPTYRQSAEDFFLTAFPEFSRQTLPTDHPVYETPFPLPGREFPVQVLAGPGRKSVFFLGTDTLEQWSRGLTRENIGLFQLGANLLAFAAGDRDWQTKFDFLRSLDQYALEKRLTMGVWRHAGQWDICSRLSEVMTPFLARSISVGLREVPISEDAEYPRDMPMLWIRGNGPLELTDSQKKYLRQFAEDGGLLLFDASYGNQKFARDAEEIMKSIFGRWRVKPLAESHPLLTGAFGRGMGMDVTTVQYSPAAQIILKSRFAKGKPLFVGAEMDGRLVALTSRFGLAAAAEGQAGYNSATYDTTDARKLVLNILLYSYAGRMGALAE
jgi:hypothetical protein